MNCAICGKEFGLWARMTGDAKDEVCKECEEEGPARLRELLEHRALITHRKLSTGFGESCRRHRGLVNGIASLDWPGWKIYAPPLGPDCDCTLTGLAVATARRLISNREGFDLTLGIPAGVELTPGWDAERIHDPEW